MNIVINSSHLPISQSVQEYVREYVSKKFKKLEKFPPELSEVHLSLATEKHIYYAEITGHHSHLDLHSKAMSHNIYSAIGLAIEKMIVLLKKSKARHAPQLSRANVAAISKDHLNLQLTESEESSMTKQDLLK